MPDHPLLEPEAIELVLERLASADARAGAAALDRRAVRFLVDLYYQRQRDRVRLKNQFAATLKSDEPNVVISFIFRQARQAERVIEAAMGHYMEARPVGRWMMAQVGVGPVLSAGIYAHVGPIDRAPTVGHWWRLAGYDPTRTWISQSRATEIVKHHAPERGRLRTHQVEAVALAAGRTAHWIWERHAFLKKSEYAEPALSAAECANALSMRPWNADLKTLMWKFADCACKHANRKGSFYGPLYQGFKAEEVAKNARGDNADAAKAELVAKRYGDNATRAALESGRLSDAHVHARALRRTAKIFLCHLHEVAFRAELGREPPKPYIIAHDARHTNYIPPPPPVVW